MLKNFFHSTIGSFVMTAIVFGIPWIITQNGLDTVTVGSILRAAVTWLKLQYPTTGV